LPKDFPVTDDHKSEPSKEKQMEQYQTALECVDKMLGYLIQSGQAEAAERCLVAADETRLFPAKELNKLSERYGLGLKWVEQ
jgi:hypothetical protein